MVIELGENAHMERRDKPDADIQETHVASAVRALVPLARRHQLIITHGNGPQVARARTDSANDPGLSQPTRSKSWAPDPGHDRLLAPAGSGRRTPRHPDMLPAAPHRDRASPP